MKKSLASLRSLRKYIRHERLWREFTSRHFPSRYQSKGKYDGFVNGRFVSLRGIPKI